MRSSCRPLFAALGSAALFMVASCTGGPSHHATSIVNYLYPDRREHVETPTVPLLSLPLRVGIAFVPSEFNQCSRCDDDAFPETERLALMNKVAEHFHDSAFVKSIEIIPSAYLTPQGSFANLDQLRSMFGIDVIALVSYDQIQFNDQKRTSLTYWTIIGAYLVEGEKNDTRTMMDAVVYDIASRRLLFRAPGVSSIRGSSTPVNLSQQLRRDREKGFRLASTELITNLDQQLAVFREKVKNAPSDYRVVKQPEYRGGTRGGGSADVPLLVLVLGLGGASLLTRRRRVRATS